MATSPNVLVTGGAGFIGSCFVRRRLQQDQGRVVVLDKLTYAACREALPDEHPRMRFIEGDICDSSLVRQLLTEHQIAQVVHLAAETHVDRSIEIAEPFVQNNVVGAARLLDACLHYWRAAEEPVRTTFRILNVSTDEVYGSLGDEGKFTETTPYDPSSPYSASKAASDHFFRAFHRTYGLPTVTTNCSNNFGPYQFPEKLIPLMILNAWEGRPLPVYGDGLQVRDWLHVEDHVDALEVVLKQGVVGQSYNIGGNCELPNLELVQMICDAVDRLRPDLPHGPSRQLIQHVEDRPGHDRRYAIDCSKVQQRLGWQPQSSIHERLEETVRWYVDHADWISQLGAHRKRRGL